MSNFTVQLRWYCESVSGLPSGSSYNDIIAASYNKVFSFQYPIYDEAYRAILEKKIIKHYYMREIGMETVGQWKLFLDARMNEIMPYYNQLYSSTLLEFNPLYDMDVKRTHTVTVTGNQNDTGSLTINGNDSDNRTETEQGDVNNSNTTTDLFSDTPQNKLEGVDTMEYLTTAKKQSDSGSVLSEISRINTDTFNTNRTHADTRQSQLTNIEEYIETVSGKGLRDSGSYSEMLMKFRETFLNIDMMIIKDLSDIFMNVYFEAF